MDRGNRHRGEGAEVRYAPGQLPMGLVAVLVLFIGLAVWQFSSLVPHDEDFPSDNVDVVLRPNEVVVYNPTNSLVDVYTVSIQRLSGTYSHTDRNLRPRSVRHVSLKRLRRSDGTRVDLDEPGECRIRLEYWMGTEKQDLFRYCRGF